MHPLAFYITKSDISRKDLIRAGYRIELPIFTAAGKYQPIFSGECNKKSQYVAGERKGKAIAL